MNEQRHHVGKTKFREALKDTMNKGRIVHALWASAIAAGCVFTNSAHAADVNKLVAVCADCHGKLGASTEPDIPIIGGYSSEFLVNNLKAYQTKDRDCPETKYRSGSKRGQKADMCQIVKDFSSSDIKVVADYFAKQKFVRAKQKFDPALAEKGKELHENYCEECHSEGGTVSDDDTGMPAGQWMPYLRHAIQEFKTGKRPMPKKMKDKQEQIDGDGIEALIHYYGSFR